jgi:hypothetical protein
MSSRQLLIVLFGLSISLITASTSSSPSEAGAVEGTTYLARKEIGRSALRCDGDSTYALLEIRHAGTDLPASGVQVRIGGNGVFSTRDGVRTTDEVSGVTDHRGIFRVSFSPEGGNSPYGWYLFYEFAEGSFPEQSDYLTVGSCAFSSDTTHVLSGVLFEDDNADGVMGRGERIFRNKWISLRRLGSNPANQVLPHHQRTDESGAVRYTGLSQSDSPIDVWTLCLGVQGIWDYEKHPWPRHVNNTDDDYEVVSVNGQRLESADDCVHGIHLDRGETSIIIGVRRAR